MLRRSLTLIVMLGFVSGQTIAQPHAHAASITPVDHDSRPHFHLSLFSHFEHSHEPEHAHHHHANGSHSHSPSADEHSRRDDHDSDAVYLPNNIGDSLANKAVAPVDCLALISVLVVADFLTAPCDADRPTWAFFSERNSSGQSFCPVLRALRI